MRCRIWPEAGIVLRDVTQKGDRQFRIELAHSLIDPDSSTKPVFGVDTFESLSPGHHDVENDELGRLTARVEILGRGIRTGYVLYVIASEYELVNITLNAPWLVVNE
jgi:hypothetical protein